MIMMIIMMIIKSKNDNDDNDNNDYITNANYKKLSLSHLNRDIFEDDHSGGGTPLVARL